jgi:hypothetical protein
MSEVAALGEAVARRDLIEAVRAVADKTGLRRNSPEAGVEARVDRTKSKSDSTALSVGALFNPFLVSLSFSRIGGLVSGETHPALIAAV